jgi:hypothetical protein
MAANREPPLSAIFGSIEQDLRDGIAFLAAGSEPSQGSVPNGLTRL